MTEAPLSPLALLLVNALVALAMVLVVPLGLRLLRAPGLARVARWWALPAGAGVLSLCLPRGAAAAVLGLGYCAGTAALAGCGATRLFQTRNVRPVELAAATALATPLVAGIALVAERAGYQLFGFGLQVLVLTVAHFHYAGFAAALVAGLVARRSAGWAGATAALAVPAGTTMVGVGYFTGDAMELAGAGVLTAGLWLAGWVTVRAVRPQAAPPQRRLFLLSAGVLAATMLLALWYAGGEAFGLPHPSLTTMAATHGLANALGFAVCGLLAWNGMKEDRL